MAQTQPALKWVFGAAHYSEFAAAVAPVAVRKATLTEGLRGASGQAP